MLLKFTRFVFLATLIAICFSFAAQSDVEEATRQDEEYCHNVANGIWPDYKNNFAKECKEKLDEVKQSL
jgi:hypothetical protein